MAYERVQRFARKAMTPFFWSSLFFRTNSKKWILPARFVGRMRVTSKKQPRKHNNLRPRNVAIVKLMSCTVIFLHVLLMIYVSWEMFGQIQEIDNDFCLRKHVHNSLYMIFGICWFLTRLIRNRMVHALTGNGGPTAKGSKGGGKNAYNTAAQVDPEIAFAQAMKTAMPEAAKIRMQPKLIQSQWTQTIKEWQHLDATGGVAIAPKESIPTILAKVGYSSKPTAILIVQEPDELGMVGYPRSRVKCSYDVVSTGGIRKQVEVERWLVQLGFSEQVSMQPIGDEVQVGFTMTRMVAKFSVHRGWAHGPHPAGVLANHLQQFVDENAFDSIMSRGDGSFLFLVHNTFEDELLSKSGANGIFLKRHVSEIDMGHELFWLEESTTLDDAYQMSMQAKALGLVEKGTKGRLAVRFRDEKSLQEFATSNQLVYDNSQQRWKVTGIPLQAGIQGLHQLLASLGWEVLEIIYQGEDSAVFTSKNRGKDAPVHFRYLDQPRAVRFKAINLAARKEAESTAKASRTPKQEVNERAKTQQAFLKRLEATAKVSSPAKTTGKRQQEGHTGETPEPKR
jgi:hypothetical protein